MLGENQKNRFYNRIIWAVRPFLSRRHHARYNILIILVMKLEELRLSSLFIFASSFFPNLDLLLAIPRRFLIYYYIYITLSSLFFFFFDFLSSIFLMAGSPRVPGPLDLLFL